MLCVINSSGFDHFISEVEIIQIDRVQFKIFAQL